MVRTMPRPGKGLFVPMQRLSKPQIQALSGRMWGWGIVPTPHLTRFCCVWFRKAVRCRWTVGFGVRTPPTWAPS